MKQSDKKTQKNQEKRIALLLGGKRQPLSGAADTHKGDALSDDFLIEAKQTANKSISLKLGWLEKIDAEATAVDRYPLLDIEFLNATPRSPKEWIAVPKYVFEIIMENWKK